MSAYQFVCDFCAKINNINKINSNNALFWCKKMHRLPISKRFVRRKLRSIQRNAIEKGLKPCVLKQFYTSTFYEFINIIIKRSILVGLLPLCVFGVLCNSWVYFSEAGRCLLPSNYLVWEATRPLADCAYCVNVTKPIVLWNVTRHSFAVRICYNRNNMFAYVFTLKLTRNPFFTEICIFFQAYNS